MAYRMRLALALLTATVPILGCTAGRRYAAANRVLSTNLIFNPQFTLSAENDIRRNEWPSVVGDRARRESVDYRETIIDRQGNSWGGFDNDYYRRFESTRVGRSHR